MSEKLDPMGGQVELASLIAAQLTNTIAAAMSGMGGKEPDAESMLPLDAFVPGRHKAGEEIDEALEGLEGMVGI